MNESKAWVDDKMDRVPIATIITQQIDQYFDNNEQNGFVVGVYGGYGTGKTFFLKQYVKDLEPKYNVKYLNVKLVELSSDPLVAIVNCLQESLLKKNSKQDIIHILKTIVKKIQVTAVTPFARMTVNIDDLFDESTELMKFKQVISTSLEEDQMIICVDELDRCSPNFVVNFIDIITHFFDIKNLVFVLGVNKSYVEKSISFVYNDEITYDGEGYLKKFINFSIELPIVLDSLITFYIEKYQISNFQDLFSSYSELPNYIKMEIHNFNISVRVLEKVIQRLSLFLARYKKIIIKEPNLNLVNNTGYLNEALTIQRDKISPEVHFFMWGTQNVGELQERQEVNKMIHKLKQGFNSIRLIVYLAILYETKQDVLSVLYKDITWKTLLPHSVENSDWQLFHSINGYASYKFIPDLKSTNHIYDSTFIYIIEQYLEKFIDIRGHLLEIKEPELQRKFTNSMPRIIQVFADICTGKLTTKDLKQNNNVEL